MRDTHRPSVLVVDAVLERLLPLMATLSSGGLRVTASGTFAQAKTSLAADPPDLLVTGTRLGAYNGLHLVLRGKSDFPHLAAVVTSPELDPVLRADAEAMQATFVTTPISDTELLAAVLQTLFRRPGDDRLIRPPFERRHSERRIAGRAVAHDRRHKDRRHVPAWLIPPAHR